MMDPKLNPDWYRVKYNLAALHANWASDREQGELARRRGLQRQSHEEARTLAVTALQVLRSGAGGPDLRRLLERSTLPATLILFAGTIPEEKPQRGPAGEEAAEPLSRDRLSSLLEAGELTATQALAFVAGIPRLEGRVVYNLACAHTQHGRFTAAAEALVQAIASAPRRQRNRLVSWALEDPSLEPLLVEAPDLRELLGSWAGESG